MSFNHTRSKLSAKKRRKQTPHKSSSPSQCIPPSSHSIVQQHSTPSKNSSFNTTSSSTSSYTSSSSQKTCEELLASSRAHLVHVAVPQTSSILVTGLPYSEFTPSEDQDHHQANSSAIHSRKASTIPTKKASSSISPQKYGKNLHNNSSPLAEKESQLEDTVVPKTNIRDYYRRFGKVSKFVINPKGLLTPVIGDMNITTSCQYFHKDIGSNHGKSKTNDNDEKSSGSSNLANSPDSTFSVYITFWNEKNASNAILGPPKCRRGKSIPTIHSSFAITRYCEHFLQGRHCRDLNCVSLHEIVTKKNGAGNNQNATSTKIGMRPRCCDKGAIDFFAESKVNVTPPPKNTKGGGLKTPLPSLFTQDGLQIHITHNGIVTPTPSSMTDSMVVKSSHVTSIGSNDNDGSLVIITPNSTDTNEAQDESQRNLLMSSCTKPVCQTMSSISYNASNCKNISNQQPSVEHLFCLERKYMNDDDCLPVRRLFRSSSPPPTSSLKMCSDPTYSFNTDAAATTAVIVPTVNEKSNYQQSGEVIRMKVFDSPWELHSPVMIESDTFEDNECCGRWLDFHDDGTSIHTVNESTVVGNSVITRESQDERNTSVTDDKSLTNSFNKTSLISSLPKLYFEHIKTESVGTRIMPHPPITISPKQHPCVLQRRSSDLTFSLAPRIQHFDPRCIHGTRFNEYYYNQNAIQYHSDAEFQCSYQTRKIIADANYPCYHLTHSARPLLD